MNRRHVLVKLLSGLTALGTGPKEALVKELNAAVSPLNPVAAIWFGSTARGDESPSSDVDLLVVVRSDREKARAREALLKRGGPFYWRFGNRLAPIVLSRREFAQRKGGGFVAQALAHGVWVRGGPDRG